MHKYSFIIKGKTDKTFFKVSIVQKSNRKYLKRYVWSFNSTNRCRTANDKIFLRNLRIYIIYFPCEEVV